MVHSETQCLLHFIIALDEYIARDPAGIPSGLVRGEHSAPAQRTVARQSGAGGRGRIIFRRIGARHRDYAVELGHLPGYGAPAPGPAQRERPVRLERIAPAP
jgi:hypothetical protein